MYCLPARMPSLLRLVWGYNLYNPTLYVPEILWFPPQAPQPRQRLVLPRETLFFFAHHDRSKSLYCLTFIRTTLVDSTAHAALLSL